MSRILAVDLRSRRLGYAVFEVPHSLLAHGNSQFDTTATVRRRTRTLMNVYQPSLIVLDRGASRGPHDAQRTAAITRAIRTEAKTISVEVTVVRAETVRDFFSERGVSNKYGAAALLASWFPQLEHRVPVERECYDPEPWIMAWIDAIGIGIVYLMKSNQESAEFFRRSLDDE